MTELRKMQLQDLCSDVREQQKLVSKLRLGVKLQKEKDTAKYKNEKKQLARMRTILTEKQCEALRSGEGERRVAAPKQAKKKASVSSQIAS